MTRLEYSQARWMMTRREGKRDAFLSAGYDPTVTHFRWSFSSSLGVTPPNNTGDVRFTARIK